MYRTERTLAGLFTLVVLLPQSMSLAQQSQDSEKPLPGPKFLNLRWDEDSSYLDGEKGSYRQDYFDPIKNIHLDENWRLSLGGEFRFRLESESNKAFGAVDPTQDTFHLYRYLVHADFKYRDDFRIFAQMITTFDEDRNLALRGIDENRWDVHQLFFDLKLLEDDGTLTLRVGRQELQYGNQRFVSPLDWANVRRRFDAVKLFWRGDPWDIDFWFAKPVPVQRKQRDRFNEQFDFYGMYATYKGIPRHGLDLYAFATDVKADSFNPNGRLGDHSRYTLGLRFWGKTGDFDYEAEVAGQWGRWAGDTIEAWSASLVGGYTFTQHDWKPRLGVGFDFASGDDNPLDGKVETFNQLFPLGHAYFGFLDLVGRQNILAFNVNLSAWPVKGKVKTAMAFHTFWLHSNKDALYNAGGGAGRRDPTGSSGSDVGHELDLTVLWKLNAHASILLGYSHFFESDFIQKTGVSEDPDLFYVQYGFKF